MKTHKVKSNGLIIDQPHDWFNTFCGISDDNSPTEDLIENYLVGEHDECTCKICNKAYKKYYKKEE